MFRYLALALARFDLLGAARPAVPGLTPRQLRLAVIRAAKKPW